MKDLQNILSVAELQPDYLGFIFYSPSSRFVGEDPSPLLKDVKERFPNLKLTGVFVNEGSSDVLRIAQKYRLDAVQLHGTESPETCERIFSAGVEVIKAFGVSEAFDFSSLAPYERVCHYFLFDTKTSQHGGSGRTFDWNILKKYSLEKPFFLSGGLGLENIKQVPVLANEHLFGVDLNSRFEVEPGVKDVDRLSQTFNILRTSERL